MTGEQAATIETGIRQLQAQLHTETERLNWLLSLEGRKAFYWAVENGDPFTREDIDAKRGA